MTQSRSKRVFPRHIIATLAISGASVAGMAAPSFAGNDAPSDTQSSPANSEDAAAGGQVLAGALKVAENANRANQQQNNDIAEGRTGQADTTEESKDKDDKGGNTDTESPNGNTESPSQTPSASPSGNTPSNSPSATDPTQSSQDPSETRPNSGGDLIPAPTPGTTTPPANNGGAKIPGLNTGTAGSDTGAANGGNSGSTSSTQDPSSVPVVPTPHAGSAGGSGQAGGSAQKTTTSNAQLPKTGASVSRLAAIAVAAAGTGGLLVARRRRAY